MIENLPFSIWGLVKIFFLIAIGIYIVFAAVVVRQVYIMTKTIESGFEFPIKTIGWVLLFLAITVFLYALAIL